MWQLTFENISRKMVTKSSKTSPVNGMFACSNDIFAGRFILVNFFSAILVDTPIASGSQTVFFFNILFRFRPHALNGSLKRKFQRIFFVENINLMKHFLFLRKLVQFSRALDSIYYIYIFIKYSLLFNFRFHYQITTEQIAIAKRMKWITVIWKFHWQR